LERVGGSSLQQKQLLARHDDYLKLWSSPFILSLLLASESTKGGLDDFLFKGRAEDMVALTD
jgi:hypothetical protein